MAFAAGQFDAIDPNRIDNDVAAQVLGNAQELIAAQLASVDALTGKMTALLSQIATLATAGLATAASVFWGSADVKWIPRALAMGLAAAGMLWLFGACWALWGLRPRQWSTPYFQPSKLVKPRVLNASRPAMAYLAMAIWLDDNVDQNETQLSVLARDVSFVQIALLLGVLAVAAALAATMYPIF